MIRDFSLNSVELSKSSLERFCESVFSEFESVDRCTFETGTDSDKWKWDKIEDFRLRYQGGDTYVHVARGRPYHGYVSLRTNSSHREVNLVLNLDDLNLIGRLETELRSLVSSVSDTAPATSPNKSYGRTKKYDRTRLDAGDFCDLVKRFHTALQTVTSEEYIFGPVFDCWSFGSLSDFREKLEGSQFSVKLVNAAVGYERISIEQRESRRGLPEIALSLDLNSLAKVSEIEQSFDRYVREFGIRVEPPKVDAKIFIGHGRSSDWRKLKDHLVDKHHLSVEAYETGSRTGHTIQKVLEDALEANSLAILIHTPDQQTVDGNLARPNVIHETGLFQAKLGFEKVAVLLKNKTEEFSNISGLQQIRYRKIEEAYGDVLAWIKRELKSFE